MESFSPKIEIINHFDNLINRVDIDIEHCLEKSNEKIVIGELLRSSEDDRKHFRNEKDYFYVKFLNMAISFKNDIWTESTNVIDYLNQMRMRTIEELRKAQNDYLEYYKLNSSHLKSLLSSMNSIDELRSQLFADKYYFQVKLTQSEKRLWHFELFTFVTDFYISQSEINSLENLINAEKEPFCKGSPPVFDQKMVLIGLLYKSFIENLSDFPSSVIYVSKQDVLKIEFIYFQYDFSGVQLTNSTIDLSKLFELKIKVNSDLAVRRESAEINIEGLFSLKTLNVGIDSLEVNFSLRNLPSLTFFELSIPRIDENNTTQLFDQLQNIEDLILDGNLFGFNLDSFVYLRCLFIRGKIENGFNFDLFKNLSNQLVHLEIDIANIGYKKIQKLFKGYNFSKLKILDIRHCTIRTIETKFIQQFPILMAICISNCKVETIEDNAFLNSKKILFLDLRDNLLKSLYKRYFSNLTNLEYFIVVKNRLEFIEDGLFSHMKNLKGIDVSHNPLIINSLKAFDCAATVDINL